MTQINLYTGGGVSLSPIYTAGRTQSAYVRLLADEGKTLKNGEIISTCIDVLASDVAQWAEIDAPEEPEEITDAEALSILLGGDTE